MARIDHITISVQDVEEAGKAFNDLYGLQGYTGGKIGGTGVQNFLIPIGDGYVELIGVSDEQEAETNPLGRAVKKAVSGGSASFFAWILQLEEKVQPTADRLGLPYKSLRRARPDGSQVGYTLVGLDKALEDQAFPFFIEWEDRSMRPDQVPTKHSASPLGFDFVEISGNKAQLENWIGPQASSLPIKITEGPHKIEAFGIRIKDKTAIEIRSPLKLAV